MDDVGPALFLGLTAKRRRPRTEWLPESVVEVCSATECMAETPVEGLKRVAEWYESGLLSREAEVRTAIEEEIEPGEFEIFAYRGFGVWFGEDGEHRELHPALKPKVGEWRPDAGLWELLGYDVLQVMREHGVWGCSPLSCNGMAREFAVNKYCLVERFGDAVHVGFEFGRTQPEPGEYVILEVWRRRGGGCAELLRFDELV